MRLKTSNLCCAFAWSPATLGTPAMVAAASFSGATPDDFDSSATLELLLADVTKTDQTEMPVVGRVSLPDRACRVDWSSHTGQQGIIAVACANAKVYIYSAAAVLKAGAGGGDGNTALIATIHHHTSSVRACQFNVSQPHFLATGDDSGAWFLWNLPRAEAPEWRDLQPLEIMRDKKHTHAVVHLQWHPRYPHIIATAASNGTVNAWNLRTESLVTSLSVYKASRGAGATCIAWNPTAATQLAVGLDDPHPVVQIWDLKCSMSPVRELIGHTRGVSNIAWSTQDASMLASCAGDGRTIWWDPASGTNCGELQPESSFVVDVQWCPVLRGVLATSSFAPLLSVSTAQASGAPARVGGGGGGGGSVGTEGAVDGAGAGRSSHAGIPKWLIPPCRASANFALVVASLAPGAETQLVLTQVEANTPMSPKSSEVERVRAELSRCPAGSDERVAWLQAHKYPLLAAVASSRNDRQPILSYLAGSENAEQQQQQLGGRLEDDDDPFAQISQEQQKSYEERAAEHVCSGRIEEAVEVCLDSGRFADAYTLAFLRGGAMIAKVHQRYVAYAAAEHQERRHVLIAGAIASSDYCKLVEQQVPWQEVLSTIIAYVVDGFAGACNQLGDCLRDAGNYEGAYACYVCGRNVDGVVELWRLQDVPSRTVVQNTILLEETTERGASHPYFAQCLCDYGLKLVSEGRPNEAAGYLNRAARIGDQTAAVLVDRMRYILNIGDDSSSANRQPPFQMTPIADQRSPACDRFLSQQQDSLMQQQHQQQQLQQQQQPAPLGSQPQPQPQAQQRLVPGAPLSAQGSNSSNNVNAGFRPQSSLLPNHSYPQPPQPPQQTPPSQPPNGSGYNSFNNAPAGSNMGPRQPFGSATVPPPGQQQPPVPQQQPSIPNRGGAALSSVASSNLQPPQPHPSVAPNRPPLVASSAPPGTTGSAYRHYDANRGLATLSGDAPPPPGGGAAPLMPPQQQQQYRSPLPQAAPAPVAAKTPLGPPQPRLMPHPVSGYSSMRANGSPSPNVPPPPPPRGGSALSSTAGSFGGPPPPPGAAVRQPSVPGVSQPNAPPMSRPGYSLPHQQPQPQGGVMPGGPPPPAMQRPGPPPPPPQQPQYPRY